MYAHLAPEAWHQDYNRFALVPSESARVFEIVRDDRRKLAARRARATRRRRAANRGQDAAVAGLPMRGLGAPAGPPDAGNRHWQVAPWHEIASVRAAAISGGFG